MIKEKVEEKYHLAIVGLESPPFRKLTEEEDRKVVERINAARADFVWLESFRKQGEPYRSSRRTRKVVKDAIWYPARSEEDGSLQQLMIQGLRC